MTITYSLDISSSTFLGIHRLLFRWRGSIWKSIYPELICWLLLYFALSFTYRFAMSREQQDVFEKICLFFYTYSDYIPITFMLGFYVSAVFGRWNQVFDNLGWIDSPALLVATYVRGATEEARLIRRNVIRYMILVQAMVYRDISSCVQKRFPTMDHLVTAGIMTVNELKEFDSIPSANIKYWTPIQWAFLLLQRAKDKKMIESDIIFVDMLEVYTQVVNLAVRAYFLIALFSRQYMLPKASDSADNRTIIDLYVPVMTILQFLFYIGWMKVAEVLLNPLGEDDDDFETNWIIDRNLQVGLSIVDDCYGRVPEPERDAFWEDPLPEPLYTPESASRPHNPMVGSCNDVNAQEDALLLQPRRRRLMSTAAYENSDIKVFYDNNEGIVPVENHNPTRRASVCVNPFAESGHGRLLDSMRRKFSRAAIHPRRDSTASSTTLNIFDFDKSMNNGRLAHLDETVARRSFHVPFHHTTVATTANEAGLTVPALHANHQNASESGGLSSSNPVGFTQSLNLGRTLPLLVVSSYSGGGGGASAPLTYRNPFHDSSTRGGDRVNDDPAYNHDDSSSMCNSTPSSPTVSQNDGSMSGAATTTAYNNNSGSANNGYAGGTVAQGTISPVEGGGKNSAITSITSSVAGNSNVPCVSVSSSMAGGYWTINEMLPVIEEVQERIRRNTKDSESLSSSDTQSVRKLSTATIAVTPAGCLGSTHRSSNIISGGSGEEGKIDRDFDGPTTLLSAKVVTGRARRGNSENVSAVVSAEELPPTSPSAVSLSPAADQPLSGSVLSLLPRLTEGEEDEEVGVDEVKEELVNLSTATPSDDALLTDAKWKNTEVKNGAVLEESTPLPMKDDDKGGTPPQAQYHRFRRRPAAVLSTYSTASSSSSSSSSSILFSIERLDAEDREATTAVSKESGVTASGCDEEDEKEVDSAAAARGNDDTVEGEKRNGII